MPSKRKARSSAPAVKPTTTEPAVDEPAAGSEPVPGKPPTSINPYRTLDVERDASEAQIKSAYRKAALKHHPGRDPHDELIRV
jgi:DnaJ-class molecular chaperone